MDVTNIISKLRMERDAIERTIRSMESEGKRYGMRAPLNETVVPITVGGPVRGKRCVTKITGGAAR